MGLKDWIPAKFGKRPWITIAVIVVAIGALAVIGVYILEQVAETLGADWIKTRIEGMMK
jgi:hypothetical protein